MGAMSSANLIALSAGVQGTSSLAGGYAEGQGYAARGRFEQAAANIGADSAEWLAADAIRRGDREATEVKKAGRQVRGAQRASMAAQGINVDSGSALAIQEETADLAEEDAETVKGNAWREAFGYKTQATRMRTEGDLARRAGRKKAQQTFLTGGMQAVGYGLQGYGNYQKAKGY